MSPIMYVRMYLGCHDSKHRDTSFQATLVCHFDAIEDAIGLEEIRQLHLCTKPCTHSLLP